MSAEQPQDVERLQVSVDTPAGTVSMPVDLASGYVPVTSIVPVMRQVGEKALALEQARALETGQAVSCRMGCAACCRPLVPLSPPEAFALHDTVQALPEPERQRLDAKFAAAKARLEQAGLWSRLNDIAGSERQLTDEDVEETNRSYYALRMPCPFLEDEVCSIYQDRPSACRELLVVSPAELCQDIVQNPVRPLPVPVRISTVLGMLWGELAGGPARLVPLPVALAWAERHEPERRRVWKGVELLEHAMDEVWRYLSGASSGESKRQKGKSEDSLLT